MYQVEGYAFETKEQEHTAKHEVEIGYRLYPEKYENHDPGHRCWRYITNWC